MLKNALFRQNCAKTQVVNLRAWAWADNPADGFVLQCDLLRSIKQRFDAENIEIPFPQTTLTFGKDEVLAVSTNKN